MISFIKDLREQGLSVRDAVNTSCEARFRPVLITAAATILGLAPFLIATGLGSEVQKPLAIVVISGLMTATMMTLVLMPLLYRWFDDQPRPQESETLDGDLSPVANADLPPSLISRILTRFRKGSSATRG